MIKLMVINYADAHSQATDEPYLFNPAKITLVRKYEHGCWVHIEGTPYRVRETFEHMCSLLQNTHFGAQP